MTTRGRPHLALAFTAGLVGFLLVTTWTQARVQSESAAGRREQLAALVAARERHVAGLERELAALRRQLEAGARADRGGLRALELERERIAAAAGTTRLRGRGLTVELADSSETDPNDPDSADFQIQDVDVQLVVNALWEAGAEAVAINGQRIVSTTAIRSAGGAVLINYKVLTSPFRIEALGDARNLERMFQGSAIAKRFQSWVEVYGLGFTVKRADRLTLPAYSGSIRLRYARPAG